MRKSGGAYVTAVGALRRIDESGRALVLEGGARIPSGRPLRPRAALERDGNQAGPKNRRRSPGGCAAFAATYFVPDARKSGGAYVTAVGALRRIDESGRALVLEGGARIPLDDLSDLALL